MPPLTAETVRADVAAQLFLEPGEVLPDANLFQEGLDSVGLLELVTSWRGQGAEISFADLAEQPTLHRWQAMLEKSDG